MFRATSLGAGTGGSVLRMVEARAARRPGEPRPARRRSRGSSRCSSRTPGRAAVSGTALIRRVVELAVEAGWVKLTVASHTAGWR